MPARNPNAAPTLANDKTPGPGVTSNRKTAIPNAIIYGNSFLSFKGPKITNWSRCNKCYKLWSKIEKN